MFLLLLMLAVKSPSVEGNYVNSNPTGYNNYLPANQPTCLGHAGGYQNDYNSVEAPGYPLYRPTIPNHPVAIQPVLAGNDLLAAILLSTILGAPKTKPDIGNHPDQVSVNPYITLLLSQYGRYLPIHALGTKGLYHYAASNNFHNNKPFGSYKVYENTR